MKSSKRMVEGMEKASKKILTDDGIEPPKKGDVFRCDVCGMELEITEDCKCKDAEMVHLHCCGQELIPV